MWLKPNADVGDILSIWNCALSVDGYQYATDNLGLKCATLANRKLGIFNRRGFGRGSLGELRCCLFYKQKRWYHFIRCRTAIVLAVVAEAGSFLGWLLLPGLAPLYAFAYGIPYGGSIVFMPAMAGELFGRSMRE